MKKIQSNTLISPEKIRKIALLVSGEDPDLVLHILNKELELEEISKSRGFHTYDCNFRDKDTPFTLMITGIGPSCTEIAFTELAICGTRIFLRAGTSGGLLDIIEVGNIVITSEALCYDGVSNLYLKNKKKVIADKEVVKKIVKSAKNLGIKYLKGTTLTTSAFYAMGAKKQNGEILYAGYSSAPKKFTPNGFEKLKEILENKEIINIDMETATLLMLSEIYGMKAGSITGISNKIPWKENEQIKFTNLSLKNSLIVAINTINYFY